MTRIWAHAGAAAVFPPNTMAAYRRAVDDGADGIELDVHLSRDGRLVCHHDPSVPVPGGTSVLIRDTPYADLQALGDDEDARIPVLEEVLDLLRPTALALNVEVKNGPVVYPGIEEALVRFHRASGMGERIVYSSFNHFTLLELGRLIPDAPIAPLYSEGLVDPWVYLRHLGVTAVHPMYLNLHAPGILAGLAAAGIAVRAWTVNEPTEWRWLFDHEVDAVITDDPAGALAVRDAPALRR